MTLTPTTPVKAGGEVKIKKGSIVFEITDLRSSS
jgi:hypothetical protein